jgi:CRISPR system Cascade subunit CasC
MKVELHILQNFAPSNLNRDDTGSPKSCEFGGYRRARVSSQALKRTARAFACERGWLDKDDFGKRSLLFKTKFVEQLKEARKEEGEARAVADFIFSKTGLIDKDAEESGYLLFLGKAQFHDLKDLCLKHWLSFAALTQHSATRAELQEKIKQAKKERGKIEKAAKKQPSTEAEKNLKKIASEIAGLEKQVEEVEKLVAEAEKTLNKVAEEADDILNTKRAADVAMFGRMITSAPKYNVAAASQVAHAISTNTVNDVELDYFTALDELKDPAEPGAAHINTAEFNSACYYRYANVDTEQLGKNLKDGASKLACKTLKAFLQAFVLAVPSGKQNAFASPTPPSLVLAVVREHSLCSLANAFETPIREREKEQDGIIGSSIRRLAARFDTLEEKFGDFIGKRKAFVLTEASEYLTYTGKDGQPKAVSAEEVSSLKELIEKVVAEVFPTEPRQEAEGV